MNLPPLLNIIIGAILGTGIAIVAYKFHTLSLSGAIAAAILGSVIFGLGGFAHSVVLLAFFISSSALSRLFKKQKRALDEKHAKGNRRDAGQVLANGGVSGMIVLIQTIFPDQDFWWYAYCASLAAANADTWASELGVLSKTRPRIITTWQQVEMGTSGGVTLFGTMAALGGAAFITVIGWMVKPEPWSYLVGISLLGLFGAMVDSILGATIQAVYTCPHCQKETERHPTHSCGSPTRLKRGLNWLNNDWVNGFCTLSPVVVVYVVSIL